MGRGSSVRWSDRGVAVMTGEFVTIEKIAGRAFVAQIVGTSPWCRLTKPVQRSWPGHQRDDFVQLRWCALVGDDDVVVARTPTLEMFPRCEHLGHVEIVLRSTTSWLPVRVITDVAVVWPARDVHEHRVSIRGMSRVFIIAHELHGNTFVAVDADEFATFPETHPEYGFDADGLVVLQESVTTLNWHARTQLRWTIAGAMAATLNSGATYNSAVLHCGPFEFDLLYEALEHVADVRQASATDNTYVMLTDETALRRRLYTGTALALSLFTPEAFEAVEALLGRQWNVTVGYAFRRAAGMTGQVESRLQETTAVRAIIPGASEHIASAGDESAEADAQEAARRDAQEEMDRLEHEDMVRLGMLVESEDVGAAVGAAAATKPKRRRLTKNQGLVLKYDAAQRKLSVRVCWQQLPWSTMRPLLPAPTPAPKPLPEAEVAQPRTRTARTKRASRFETIIGHDDPRWTAPAASWAQWETPIEIIDTRATKRGCRKP